MQARPVVGASTAAAHELQAVDNLEAECYRFLHVNGPGQTNRMAAAAIDANQVISIVLSLIELIRKWRAH
jgi:hypothetical protein